MPIDIDYEFRGPKKEDPPEQDVRPNLRVTRCCANCKFYTPKMNRANRGYCKYPDPKDKNLKKIYGESIDWKEVDKTWSRAHATMLCDLYQIRGRGTSIRPIEVWLDKEILTDGTIKKE